MKKILAIMVLMAGVALCAGEGYWKQIEVAKGFYEDGTTPKTVTENVWVDKPVEKPVLNYSYEKRFKADGSFDVWIVSDACTKRVDPDKPNYLEYVTKGYEVKEVAYVAPKEKTEEEIQAEALAVTMFKKIDIRRAFREIGKEAELDALIKSNPLFEKDWLDSENINLADPVVAEALKQAQFDVNIIKLKIAEMNSK